LRTTANDKSIFVHIFDWPATAACEITGIEAKVTSARLLANGKPLAFHQSEGKLHIDIPEQAPDPNVSVIALKTY
jgi:alpha-L-fucosidase